MTKPKTMEKMITVNHQRILLNSTYELFTGNLESLVKRLHPEYANGALMAPQDVQSYLESLQGDTGLILFNIENHGDLLNLYGKPRKAKQYVIGNPLIAIQMTVQDIRAALYAPLRMIVYESEDHNVFAEYDLPSTLFGQFGNTAVLEVAIGLDLKLLKVINLADLYLH
jgi:uncharacterized protein (DUF302 family)